MQLPSASPQGIAAAYMGNPGALQQKVQKEQQARPGLPPDLKNLMALNIVTNEQDAVKRQQAMNALNQMAPGGQPPTVAQSIQEQAKQKMQARMLQQAQQQQGLQALMQQSRGAEVPQGTPQPERQPEAGGIDQLPVEFGEFSGGGIVAFAGGETVSGLEKIKEENMDILRPIAENLIAAQNALVAAARSGDENAVRKYSQDQDAYRQQLNIATEGRFGNQAASVINELLAKKAAAAEPAPAAAPAAAQAATQTGLRGTMGDQSGDFPMRSAPPAVVKDLKSAAALQGAPVAPRMTPELKAALAPAQAPMVEPQQTEYDKILGQRTMANPETARQAGIESFRKMVSAPDTTQIDRLISELEGRKTQLNAPTGMDALVEYARQYGQGPRWYEQGQKAGIAQQAAEKERLGQQFELTKQQIEAAQKKADIQRGYSLDLYKVGQAEYDRVFKDQMDALKESGLGQREKTRLAAEAAEKAKDRVVHLEQSRIQASVHGAPTYADRQKEQIVQEWMQRNPGKTTLDAMTALGMVGAGVERQDLAELKALQANLQKQVENIALSKERRATLEAKLEGVNARIAKMAGLGGEQSLDMGALAKNAFGSYDPQAYDYRIGPNGNLQRKKKE